MGRVGGGGREDHDGGGDIYIQADSLCCKAETNATFKSNYTPIKTEKNLK